MKVLHIALNMLRQTALCDALASLGEYKEIDWIAYEQQFGRSALRQHCIDTAKAFEPDIIFMQLQTPDVLDRHTLEQMPGYKINWTGDVRQPLPQWYIDLGADLTLFTNTADVDVMREHGLNAGYLQTGFDPAIFNRGSAAVEKEHDIVFVGNHYGDTFPLSKLRYDMVHALHERYGKRFTLIGGNWDIPHFDTMYNQPLQCEIYRKTKIAINLSHFDLPRYSSDRIFHIMGSGCFCLSKDYPEMYRDLPLMSLLTWNFIDDLIDTIDKVLDYDEWRIEIAERGYNYAHESCTWQARIDRLKLILPI